MKEMRQGNCLKLLLRIKLTFSDAPEAISRINGGKIYADNLILAKKNIWKYACPMVRLTAQRNDKRRVHNRGSMWKPVIHNPYLYTEGYKEISPVLHARTKVISVRTPIIHRPRNKYTGVWVANNKNIILPMFKQQKDQN